MGDLVNAFGKISLETTQSENRDLLTSILAALGSNTLGQNDLGVDAWGRQKVVEDFSLFRGLFTYDVPNRVWEENKAETDGTWTEQTSTGDKAVSEGGALHLYSGITANEGAALRSRQHPRYQPNRGQLYSTAVILPNATADGIRRFGIFSVANGVCFELEGDGSSWTLYAVRRSNGVNQTRVAIDVSSSYDPEKGHVYDIQYQWRGVGNYKFFIDLEEVYVDAALGTLTELSVQNPANHAAFECVTHTTTQIEIIAGCVDISSEGGNANNSVFQSFTTGETLLGATATGTAMIGIYLPRTVEYQSDLIENTRDCLAQKASSWCRDESAIQIYFARDTAVPNLKGLTWTNRDGSNVQSLVGGDTSALDNAFQTDRANMDLVVNEWVDLEQKNVLENPFGPIAPFYITPGDVLILAVKSFAGTDDSAATLYLAEEI